MASPDSNDPGRTLPPLLLDHMLGKLAVYLRMCGYDAAYAGDLQLETDEELRTVAREQGRTLLTRDHHVAESFPDGVLLQSRAVEEQLDELVSAGFALCLADPPRRCGQCNGRLVPNEDPADRPAYAPSDPAITCWCCADCGQYFWKGSHWDDVAARL